MTDNLHSNKYIKEAIQDGEIRSVELAGSGGGGSVLLAVNCAHNTMKHRVYVRDFGQGYAEIVTSYTGPTIGIVSSDRMDYIRRRLEASLEEG